VLTQLQDEVHRFAITFHRDKRSKHALHSELDDIRGIGPKTKELLLNKLKSVKRIKEADTQTLTELLGTSKAQIVYNYFHTTTPETSAE
jgi:excinuclease ABC subunit C